jgi:hypothetical protein
MSPEQAGLPIPELRKIERAREEGSEAIGAFLDWLNSRGYAICHYHAWDDVPWTPANRSIEAWLADYFDIDLEVVDRERRELLEAVRRNQHTELPN